MPGSMMLGLAFAIGAEAQDPQDEPGRRGVEIFDQSAESRSSGYARRHALVIGIDEYQDESFQRLSHAVADALEVGAVLKAKYGFEVRTLVNADASRASISDALDACCDPARVGPDDLLVVFYAGHGVTRPGGPRPRGYLVPCDGEEDRSSSLLGMHELDRVSEDIPAAHALFVMDCCFGGLATTRSSSSPLLDLGSPARQVLAAGGPDQTVSDAGGRGHSVFTDAFLAALDLEADRNLDGAVSFGELFDYVRDRVHRQTAAAQVPHQGVLEGHDGGSLALFPPDWTPRSEETIANRLRSLEQTEAEQLAEIERLSDLSILNQLEAQAEELWPRVPENISGYRDWLYEAKGVLSRRVIHAATEREVREREYLEQFSEGEIEANRVARPDWDLADRRVSWRYETTQQILERLDGLPERIADIEARLRFASTIEFESLVKYEAEWEEAITDTALDERFPDDFELPPQLGLVPLGPDPDSKLWEFWVVGSGDRPEAEPGGGWRLTETTGVVLVLLPGGSVRQGARRPGLEVAEGSPLVSPYAGNTLAPHDVTLAPFFLSKYELTQGQWILLENRNPSTLGPHHQFDARGRIPHVGATDSPEFRMNVVSLRNPVEGVSWVEARRVIAHLELCLPTEDQWEYACRAGTDSVWYTGNDPATLEGYENIADAYVEASQSGDLQGYVGGWPYAATTPLFWDEFFYHAPVGSLMPNDFGLHDMAGNVSEWCEDAVDLRQDNELAMQPGDGLRRESTDERVVRGGCFRRPADAGASAIRFRGYFKTSLPIVGIRPARRIDRD